MSALIDDYLAGLRLRLPAPIAEEAAAGLLETYEHHLTSNAGDQEAARAALAEFGDLAMVASAFTRQAPGRAPPGCRWRPGRWPARAGRRP